LKVFKVKFDNMGIGRKLRFLMLMETHDPESRQKWLKNQVIAISSQNYRIRSSDSPPSIPLKEINDDLIKRCETYLNNFRLESKEG
jgi:hypothetical protein